MVLKGVNWVHIDKIRSNGLERSQLCTQSKNHVIQYKNQVIWSWKESIWYRMQKSGQMVLKGVNCVHNAKIRSYGVEESIGYTLIKAGTQCKNQVIWSWKESIGYTLIKLGQMVLKGVNRVNNAKTRSYGVEKSQLSTHW